MSIEIFTLSTIPTLGLTEQIVKASSEICKLCGNEMFWTPKTVYFRADNALSCDLVTDRTRDIYLISRCLLERFIHVGIRGYNTQAIELNLSYEENLSSEEIDQIISRDYQVFHITGNADGPWDRYSAEQKCVMCNRAIGPMPDNSFHQWSQEALGNLEPRPVRVYKHTWKKDDIFRITEPGPPIVTKRIEKIMQDTGNLQCEEIKDKEKIRRIMPEYAEQLDSKGWVRPICTELGCAEWVSDRTSTAQ